MSEGYCICLTTTRKQVEEKQDNIKKSAKEIESKGNKKDRQRNTKGKEPKGSWYSRKELVIKKDM